LAVSTISFDIAGLELYLPLIAGAELVIADTSATKDGRLLLAMLTAYPITIMQATPTTLQMMLDSGWEQPLPIKILSGGEALSKDLAETLLKLSKELWNMYGPTETTVWTTLKQILTNQPIITIGKAIPNTQVYILDAQNQPLPVNQVGEICIAGDGIGRGYLNRAELTTQNFINHFNADKVGQKLYKTGDLGKILVDGEIICFGRIDQQVKIRGHRIELGEIEAFVLKQDGVKQAVVTVQDITPGDKRLVAFIIADENNSIIYDDQLASFELIADAKKIAKKTVAIWKENLRSHLPAYMVPDYFIALKSFPLTPNAKIDRKALPSLKFSNIQPNNSSVLSTNENMVAEIYTKILGVQDLKPNDDFFELGGHSLLAIKVMVEIEKNTGARLPLTVLFNNSTIASLAAYLSESDQADTWKSLVPIKTDGTQPPIYIIHGRGMNIIGFRSLAPELDIDQPFYGLQAKGLNPDDEPMENIEAIAAAYIQEISHANQQEPYALIGYSSGGIVALEMSAQLEKMGKKLLFLGLLDTYVYPDNYKELFEQKDYKGIWSFTIKSVAFSLSCLATYPIAYLTHNTNFILGTLYNYYKKFNPIKLDKSNPLFIIDRLQKAHDRALGQYQYKKYNTPVHLFKANDRIKKYIRYGKTNGLEPFIEGKINVIKIPLGHLQFFEPPFVKIFAAELKNAIDKVNGES
jgi:thioesterase domain-containing protein/acyl carrier protein